MRVAAVVIGVVLSASPALAQKKPPKPEGVKLLTTVKTDKGFLDDAYAFDGAGGRLAVVRGDAASFSEVEIIDLDQGGQSVGKFDLSKATIFPVQIAFVLDGQKLVVIGRDSNGEKKTGFLTDLSGKVLKKWGPAADVVLSNQGGVDLITTFDHKPSKKGTTYDIAVIRLDTGKSFAKKAKTRLDADGEDFVKSLDMKILYWEDGYTTIVGRKKGLYDKFKDQRMNDSEAHYSLVDGTFVSNQPMADVMAWAKLVKLRADRPNQSAFLHVTEDLHGVELVTGDDKRIPVTTTEQFYKYDPKSLAFELGRDGKIYFTLTIDPVNPDAVAKKVADPEIIDLYALTPPDGKATRIARLPKNDRPFNWHATGARWSVLRKHKGFDRGGAELEIYDLTGK